MDTMISVGTRIALFSLIYLMCHSPLVAGSVSIIGEAQGDRLEIKVENASTADVLQRLGERFGFKVQGLRKAKSGGKFSVTLTGTLKTILERLLRNRNHMIEQSFENDSAILRVVILDSNPGSSSPVAVMRKATAGQRFRSIAERRRKAAERRRELAASRSEPRQ